eukprot:TRINITY_DN21268_c0_g1_i1.p1 TRINITY_DN21268_c0_g1~~TRINITY_DN21268_c0_g1_i1.p1  ORF type:complete len:768 (+),score=246.92 TRINITY_DN21268_c0_g1_i1:34-2304(+)
MRWVGRVAVVVSALCEVGCLLPPPPPPPPPLPPGQTLIPTAPSPTTASVGPNRPPANCGPASSKTETRTEIEKCLTPCCDNAPDDQCVCWSNAILGEPPNFAANIIRMVDQHMYCMFHECMMQINAAQCQYREIIDGYKQFMTYIGPLMSTYLNKSAALCPISCSTDGWKQVHDICVPQKASCFISSDPAEACTSTCVSEFMACVGVSCNALDDSSSRWSTEMCVARYDPNNTQCELSDVEEFCQDALSKPSHSNVLIILIPAVTSGVVLCAVLIAGYCCYKYKKKKPKEIIKIVNVKTEKDIAPILAALDRGEWSKGKVLGRGQFGTVFLALLPGGSALACKQINIGGQSEEAIMGYMREATTMRELKHENIVQLYYTQYNREAGTILLFMEYVQGGSLGRLVRSMDSHLSESQAVGYIRQIVNGVHYLHSNGIVHRDIKGDNVLVDTSEGVCKISDFGSSKNINGALMENNQMATITGTPNWMAPEMITNSGKADYDEKVDIWSIGCTTVEVLNKGKPPWPEFSTQWAAIYHIANTDAIPDIPENLSGNCQNFILNCLKRDPKQRPTTAELLGHPWFAMEFDEGSEAPSVDIRMKDMNDEMHNLIARTSTENKTAKASLDTAVTHPVRESYQSVHTSVNTGATHDKSVPRGNEIAADDVEFEMKPFQPTVDNGSVLIGTMPSYVPREHEMRMTTDPYEEPKAAHEMDVHDADGVPSFTNQSRPYGADDEDDDLDHVNIGTVPSAVVRGVDFSMP